MSLCSLPGCLDQGLAMSDVTVADVPGGRNSEKSSLEGSELLKILVTVRKNFILLPYITITIDN